jgi:hypothetical protein
MAPDVMASDQAVGGVWRPPTMVPFMNIEDWSIPGGELEVVLVGFDDSWKRWWKYLGEMVEVFGRDGGRV